MQKPAVVAIAATGAMVPAPHRQAINGRRRAGLHEGGLGVVRPAISRLVLTDGRVSVRATSDVRA